MTSGEMGKGERGWRGVERKVLDVGPLMDTFQAVFMPVVKHRCEEIEGSVAISQLDGRQVLQASECLP